MSNRNKNGKNGKKHQTNGHKHPTIEPPLARHARGEKVPEHELQPKAAPEDQSEDVPAAPKDYSRYAADQHESELARYRAEFLHVPIRVTKPPAKINP